MRRESALDLECGGRGRAGCVEDAEELVAPTVDLATARPLDRATLQFARLGEHGGVAAAEAFGQTARVLDVAEEEGERHAFSPDRCQAPRPDRQLCANERALPRSAFDPQVAVERFDTVAKAAEPGAAISLGAPHAVVGDLDLDAASKHSTRTLAASAWACLTTFASASETV